MTKTWFGLAAMGLSCCLQLHGADSKRPPMLSPADFLKTVELQDGYYLEPVLTEPDIMEPVDLAFDGNGRMYVLEMRTYMRDADYSNEMDATSVVSLHEDKDGDGVYETHSVFADKLVLPRKIIVLNDGVVIGETNTHDLYFYQDTDGDGKADKKELWYQGGKRDGNMEHQPNGFVWGLDNWLYSTYNNYRLRFTDGKVVKDDIGSNQGQWGLTQDNYGKVWFVNAGGERGPVHYQAHIEYGRYMHKETAFDKATKEVWPIDNIPDVQGGLKRIRDDNTLNHYTATCGQVIYRGDRLPHELQGDLFFSEPVGRLIRRLQVTEDNGQIKLVHPYHKQKEEFIRSTDPNFRVVNMKNAPDGSMYIIDMYRGIIQQGNWTRPESYLRGIIDEYGLAKNIDHGRIWRLRHRDFERDTTRPKMMDESPKQLLKHLDHPNGWWRDQAQKFLILKGDKSLRGDLVNLTKSSKNSLERLHAYWVLEGLGALDKDLVLAALQDEDINVVRSAMRFGEQFMSESDVEAAYVEHASSDDVPTMMQALLSMKAAKSERWQSVYAAIMTAGATDKSKDWFFSTLGKGGGASPAMAHMNFDEQKLFLKGQEVYQTLCIECHGEDGRGRETAGGYMAPTLVKSPRVIGPPETAVQIVLNGMKGELDGKAYLAGMMMANKTHDDEWVAAVTTFIRSEFGNNATAVTPSQVATVRDGKDGDRDLWTQAELERSHHVAVLPAKDWKATASINGQEAGRAIDGKHNTRWSTNKRNPKKAWFQLELPEPTTISGVMLDSGKSGDDYGRGLELSYSVDGKNWETPQLLKKTSGGTVRTELRYQPFSASFIKLNLTKPERRRYWSVHEIRLYGEMP